MPVSGSLGSEITTLNANGRGSISFPIANDQSLVNRVFYGRWYVTDPNAQHGFSVSRRITFRIFGDQPLRVISTHLGLLKGSRLAQARHLSDEIDATIPTLLMGDLNEWRRGPGCSLMPLRQHEGASMQMAASFPANRPFLALDRIIGAGRAEVLDFAPHVSPLARLASDHLPVRARVRLGP